MELVFLHGRVATGKLTVARALGERLHYGVFHNHLVVDALTAVFPFGSPPFVELRERFWLDTFDRAAVEETSLIFTFTPEPTVRAGFPERARAVVQRAGGRVAFVQLVLDAQEQERRIAMPGRREFGKLVDLETLRRVQRHDGDPPPTDLRIDTGVTAPDDAAAQIVDHFDLRPA